MGYINHYIQSGDSPLHLLNEKRLKPCAMSLFWDFRRSKSLGEASMKNKEDHRQVIIEMLERTAPSSPHPIIMRPQTLRNEAR